MCAHLCICPSVCPSPAPSPRSMARGPRVRLGAAVQTRLTPRPQLRPQWPSPARAPLPRDTGTLAHGWWAPHPALRANAPPSCGEQRACALRGCCSRSPRTRRFAKHRRGCVSPPFRRQLSRPTGSPSCAQGVAGPSDPRKEA